MQKNYLKFKKLAIEREEKSTSVLHRLKKKFLK